MSERRRSPFLAGGRRMVSTYLDYNLIARDMKLSLRRVSEQTIVARDTQYYRENIGSVASVDEFLADYRLHSYAMKAYGLADMIESVAFMRKVLESDLSDDNSFANKLTDERYRDFTMAFSFSGGTAVSQTEAQLDEMIGLYNTSIASIGETQKEETRYYNVMIDKVTSVDQLLNNDRLRTYVFTVFGIDESTYSRETLRKVLSSNADDPDSYENTVLEPRTIGARGCQSRRSGEAPAERHDAGGKTGTPGEDSHLQQVDFHGQQLPGDGGGFPVRSRRHGGRGIGTDRRAQEDHE